MSTHKGNIIKYNVCATINLTNKQITRKTRTGQSTKNIHET